MPSGNEIRSTFLKFFADRGHRVVRSSSLVPTNDPTLLFTNAGMNQFKDVFLGLEQREYSRATSSQKCVRAGGKHNDLENVGFTNRHHTFFEMLGNFSFGDYFKKDAIAYAWELITSPNWFGIPVDKLTFTVFGGTEVAPGKVLGIDEEALNMWVNVGAPRDSVIPVPGLKENFWAMGDTGPCGPCSEIHYDMGPAASDQGHTDCKFGCDCGRYVEIWNLVFMQFNRDASGTVAPLPKPSIDTGAGLERLAAVLQGKLSNFETDLFVPLMKRAAELCGVDFARDETIEGGKGGAASLRVIADHARATTFLIADGVLPSNEGRDYVLRKILRRAIQHGRLLGKDEPFLFQMVFAVCDQMKTAYPELIESAERISGIVKSEETRFAHTLKEGLGRLEDDVYTLLLQRERPGPTDLTLTRNESARRAERPDLFRRVSEAKQGGVPLIYRGESAFKLYDTFGLPLDSIQDAIRDFGLSFDQDGFDHAMEEQRTRARASWKGGHKDVANPVYAKLAETYRTEPDFYFATTAKDCRIEAIVTKDGAVNELPAGAEGEIILDRTVFYSESGGQVSDIGTLWNNEHTMQVADVRGAYYPVSGLIAHRVVAREKLVVGDRVAGDADGARREHIKRNHTGTHLMHAALRNILGTHVKQAGSLVEPARLRFDFSHFAAIDPAELRDIEQQVNDEILLNSEIETNITTLDDALASGALAFFGDRYPEQNVRVVTIPDPSAPRGFYSKELCGGTHVRRTGDIGVFKIVVEQSAAAGVRRIEAITGAAALADYQRAQQLLREISARMGVNEENLAAAIERTEQTQKQLEKQLEAMKRKGALLETGRTGRPGPRRSRASKSSPPNSKAWTARPCASSWTASARSSDPAWSSWGRPRTAKSPSWQGLPRTSPLSYTPARSYRPLAKEVGGSGGGRPDLAEAGGKDTSGLKSALDHVYPLIDQLL